MEDRMNSKSGLISRTAKFFNNEALSDLQFDVKDQLNSTSFYAHKLILAMASEKFASLLLDKNASSKTVDVIRITDFRPKIVHLTLRYLYTDELNLTSVKEALEVLRLASLLEIKEIEDRCKNYIGLDRITEENVFFIYDEALKGNMRDVLIGCRNYICQKASVVFTSKQFCEATLEVLKDILNQNSLAVWKEMDIIDAVLRWCRRDCARKGRPTEPACIRDSIGPLLPYIRFLTLSVDEFCEFVEQNGIFTSPESVILTRKIIDPQSDCKVPSGFCSISRPRRYMNDLVLRPDTVRGTPPRTSANVPEMRTTLKVVKSPVTNEPPWPLRRPHQDIAVSPDQNRQPAAPIYSFPQNGNKDESLPSKALFTFPSETKKSPMQKMVPSPTINKKVFDFPLQEIQNDMFSMSKRDLICSAEIRVSKGRMVIYGVELKIRGIIQNPEENIRVGLSISGDCPEQDSNSLVRLSNSVIALTFSEPISLNFNCSAKIEIIIEDLKLNRCSVCKQTTHELNGGLNLATVINLNSNQSNEGDGFFFLISRIIYS